MTDPLGDFSKAVRALVAAAAGQVVAIRQSEFRHLTGTLWQSDLVVTSEQALSKRDRYDIALNGGGTTTAALVGRDPATNIALLRLEKPASVPAVRAAEAITGALAIALGADPSGAASARLGIVNLSGPQWHSRRGGRIERRIVLDARLSRAEEGGAVIDAEGSRLGITTFGPRRQVLVIPSATVERVVPLLVKEGRVPRGWLGAALHPVAVPDALHSAAGQSSGMMVMSIADGGPSAGAGVLAGDILVTIGGEPARRFRRIASLLADSVGKQLDLTAIRGGTVIKLKADITARPAA